MVFFVGPGQQNHQKNKKKTPRPQTCDIVKFSEIHLDVIPLHDHTAVGVRSSHGDVDVLFKREDIC